MHRILLLYPELSFRKLLWLALVKMGYEVVEAANPREAAKLNRCLPADVIIADLRGCCAEDLVEIRTFHRNPLSFSVIQFSPQRRHELDSDSLKSELSQVLEAHAAHNWGAAWHTAANSCI